MRLLHLLLVLLLPCSSNSNTVHGKEERTSDENIKLKRSLLQSHKKPNILIILADDVGTSDIPYWGDNIVPMENIQKLQSQGVTFMDAHASPLCAPSRYMLLSGNYPHRGLKKGGTWNMSANQNQFIHNQKSIAEVLKDQHNYHTGMYGKWHLGGRVPSGGTYSNDKTRPLSCCNIDWKKPMEDGPNDIGFDESFYTLGGIQSPPYSFFRNGYLQTNVDEIKFWRKGSYATVNDNGESIIGSPGEGNPDWDSTEYNTKLVKEVDNFLERHDTSDPFFLYVGLGPVHMPHSPVKFYLDGTPVAGTFGDPHLDMLYELDLVIGSMMSSVEDRGLMENTLVIFASDNGGLTKDINHTDEFGRHFRGGKGDVWEGGHTIPMIMRYDGVLGADQKRTGLVGLNDIYATLADFVGFDIPDGSAQDSISFADHALTELMDSQREYFGVWRWQSNKEYLQALRWSNFKFVVRYSDTKEEYLFDLNTDLKEERNLLREGSEKYDKLYKQMFAELRRLGICPLDVEEPFFLIYGSDAVSKVTCDYFREDTSRCEDQIIGELYCNSVCGRYRDICKMYTKTWEKSYPVHVFSQQPSISPTKINLDTPTNDICIDNPQFTFERLNGDTKDCNWLGEKDARKERYCGDESIASECKLACDRCTAETPSPPTHNSCTDNPQFTFEKISGGIANCNWLGKKDARINRYCSDESIASECILSCDRCKITTAPSQSPLNCEDDEDFEFVDENGWSWNCAWVSIELQRIDTRCQNEVIANACKSTCGKCPHNCANTDSFTFFNSQGEKDCSWLCKNGDIKVVQNRQTKNCIGDVLENCCEACKAGPGCA
ncbi:hypothetical protein CTEN210_17950 [Chaetoceros tenuissimus]|uniref:Sulfatase N-terminal domain-containing protein n=1 Tax=Chaetoceros tenuissimus TaxID=426638 RepID=A0AAD3HFQ3_9STRA|nr:hypothetical protein CTEN210_17950 [Chaetoceros tenuissimus]